MPRFGEFETVRLLAPGALGAVYSARPSGSSDAPTFAIHTFQPEVLVVGEAAAEAQIDAFLAQAEAQARISSAVAQATGGFTGPAIWAPVYDVGRVSADAPGAYYITDLALLTEPSLTSVLRTKVVLDHVALGAVVAKVVHALRLALQHASRPHGVLSPSRVLLLTQGDLAHTRLALIEPLPDDDPRLAAAALADQRAVGQIIYSLVQHQLPGSVFRVADQRPWTASLGKEAPRWIELVHALLDPSDSAQRPSIELLDDQLAPLREGNQRRPDARTLTATRSDIKPPTLSAVPKSVVWGSTRTRELPLPASPRQTPATGNQPAPQRGPVSAAAAIAGGPVSAVGLSGAVPIVQPQSAPQAPSPARGPVTAPMPTPPTGVPAASAGGGAGASTSPATSHTSTSSATTPSAALPQWGAAGAPAGSVPTVATTKRRAPLYIAAATLLLATGAGTWYALSRPAVVPPAPLPTDPGVNTAALPSPPESPDVPSTSTPTTTTTPTKPPPKPPADRPALPAGIIYREDAEARADAAIPPVSSDRASPPAWLAPFLVAANTDRQRAIDDAIRRSSRGSGDEVNQSALDNRLSEAKPRLTPRLDKARSVLADLLAIGDALASADAPGVDPQSPATPRWQAARAELDKEPTWKSALAPLTDQLTALESIARAADAQAITASILGASAAPPSPAAAMLSWSRLNELSWPTSAAELTDFARLRDRTLASLAGVPVPERRTSLQQRIAANTQDSWKRVAAASPDLPAFAAALAARQSLALSDDVLTPAMRVTSRLITLQSDLANPDTQEALRSTLATFDRDIDALAPPAAVKQNLERALAPVRTLATRPPKPKTPPEGPASAGATVRATGGITGDKASFQVGAATLDFERLALADREVFISTREVTIADVIAIVAGASKWAEFRDLMGLSTEDESTLDWSGPRAWVWNGRELNRNRDWLMIAGFADQSPYPQGMTKPRAPTTSAPMHAISAAAAAYVAQLVGCRFPSSAEFAAALRAAPTTAPNLWNAQCDAVAAFHSAQNWGTHWGQPFKPVRASGAGTPAGTFLFFRTAQDSADRFRDLAGNVAEFVLDRPGIVQASGPEAIRSLLTQAAADRALGVIGASRLSPPGEPQDRPTWLADQPDNLRSPSDSFADVGFRFAFNAPVTGPENIKDELAALRSALKPISN